MAMDARVPEVIDRYAVHVYCYGVGDTMTLYGLRDTTTGKWHQDGDEVWLTSDESKARHKARYLSHVSRTGN